MTIRYPDFFFSPLASPSVILQGATANLTSHNQNSVVLTVFSGVVPASSSAAITLTGFTMGNATADVADSISIITSQVAIIADFVVMPLFGCLSNC